MLGKELVNSFILKAFDLFLDKNWVYLNKRFISASFIKLGKNKKIKIK